MAYYSKQDYTIVRKHYIIAFFFMFKFIFLLFIGFVIYFLANFLKEYIPSDVYVFLLLPLVLIIINYSFIKLILSLIEFYSYLIIITWDQIMILNSSLIMKDDIEVIEAIKIIKVDVYSRGIMPNFLNYWSVKIELQSKEERTFRFIPKPYKLLEKLRKQRELVLNSRKKKYIVDDSDLDAQKQDLDSFGFIEDKKREVSDIIK